MYRVVALHSNSQTGQIALTTRGRVKSWCHDVFRGIIFFFMLIGFGQATSYAQSKAVFQGYAENGYRYWTLGNLGSGVSNYDGSEYIQNYKFGIKGYYLSSGFMTYYIGSQYRQSNKTISKTNSIERSYDLFDMNARFFQYRNIWFSVNAKRTMTEFVYKQYTDKSYDNLIGSNLYVMLPRLPRIQLGYQYNSAENNRYGTNGTHISTVQFSRNSENANVSAYFRDEQRKRVFEGGIARTQQFTLNGRSSLFDRTTSIDADIDYNNRDEFRTGRFSLRLIRNFRRADRLSVLYGYNSYEGYNANTSSNSVEADYKRELNQYYYYVVRTTLFRQNLRSTAMLNVESTKYLSNGLEYMKLTYDSVNTWRNSGNIFIEVNSATIASRDRFTLRGNRTFEKKHVFTDRLNWTNRYSADGLYNRLDSTNYYQIVNSLTNQINYRFWEPTLLQNQIVLMDAEGTAKLRYIEDRTTLSYFPYSSLRLESALITETRFDPQFNETVNWTNTMKYRIFRNLTWSIVTSHIYNRRYTSTNDRYESDLDYQLREIKLFLQFEKRIEYGQENTTVLLNASRTFGN